MKVARKPKSVARKVMPKKQKKTPKMPLPKQTSRALTVPTAVGTLRSSSNVVTKIRVAKRERLGTITSPSGSSGVVFSQYINAGNLASSTNSFLARQAQLFDKYMFKKLIFHYIPIVPTTTAGNVIFGADLSCNDAAPTDAFGMTNLSLGFSEGNSWAKHSYKVDLSKCYDKSYKYTRFGTQQLGSTAYLYDTAAFYIFTEGAPVSTTLGYVDVEYDVELVGVNRNSGEATNIGFAPAGSMIIELISGSTIAPGGLWAGTTLASFTGFNFNAANTNTVIPAALLFYPTWGTIPTYSSPGNGQFILSPGTYKIRMTVTFATDTYANGMVIIQPSGTGVTDTRPMPILFGEGPGTAPATAYVITKTETAEWVYVCVVNTTFTLQNIFQYSVAPTVNRTWNLVVSQSSTVQTRPSTSLQIDYIGAV